MASMRCSFCHDLVRSGHEEAPATTDIRPNPFKIVLSDLDATCTYCSLLRRIALHFAPHLPSSDEKCKLWVSIENENTASLEIYGIAAEDSRTTTFVRVHMYLHSDVAQILPSLGRAGTLSARSDSQECFDFIERQIETCADSHEKCTRPVETSLPTRLLKIGHTQNDLIHVEESKGQRGHYAALSHCWGRFQPVKTLHTNYAKMLQNIAWTDLSRVFQDAIQICRRLRLQYLWVDALCILQDSKEDWERESSRMCQYFESAYITISATSSPDGSVPFLKKRDPKLLAQRFELTCKDGTSVDVFARQDLGSSSANHVEEIGPLSSRAWAWQETLLSSRVLCYTISELIWVCKSSICSEDGVIPRGAYFLYLPQQLQYCYDESAPYNGWHNLISTYSTKELTYDSDRLPALSGVATKVQSLSQSKYIAGLWLNNLPLDLCWRVDNDLSDLSKPRAESIPAKYIAPSWAWPSVSGAIYSPDNDPDHPFLPLAEVEEVECSVSGLNPYGQVDHGHLILKGLVTWLNIRCRDPDNCWAYSIHGEAGRRTYMIADCKLVECNGSVRRAAESDIASPFSTELPCILLGYHNDEKLNDYYYAMILDKLDGDKYCRLGMAVLKDREWFSEAVDEKIYIM